ncbi:MAG: hypothetical protein B7Z10_03910 [Rhodobacterales bacterium 32-66-7]|nr:MAG: hypothetical protein B7Z31_15215 [Rhodobacterales bacterium 12-65-15]OYX26215.1 MAG: hypothetical protein B7Z10_03910 [Rhodobacterales bacterium 32-66-7]OZA11285.1 MAG: hypothetical protein B7Y02_09005 [Rhodobacterales bacterium 17-64-5]
MALPRRPLFLARSSYRRRRLRDAARLLPIVGLGLLLLPLFLEPGIRDHLVARDVTYFFCVWLVLIVVAALFAPGLRKRDGRLDDDD